jgi:two-component system, NarL family, response regulator NreC
VTGTGTAHADAEASEGGEGEPLRAVVVDDHPVVRAGVRVLLEQAGGRVVDEAGGLTAAVHAMRRRRPDLLILDAELADGDGVAAIPRLRHGAPECKVLVLAPDGRLHRMRAAFSNGADGYLLKSTVHIGLGQAVRDLANGRRYLDPTLAGELLHAELAAAAQPLSAREQEVLRLLARGHTNLELASMLSISARTVEAHRRNIMGKLRLASRADMVRYALRAGMLEPAPA